MKPRGEEARLDWSRRTVLRAAAYAYLLPAAPHSGAAALLRTAVVFSHCSGGEWGRHFSGLDILLCYSVEAGR
ncbi:hypothetical protein QQF64_006165 [Cirrhinus molitorella]|uniref:Uncharacterized protein n=1 Tax=Cirrhinus molitorella TaxID=172907 RepID=A0ABR3MGH5_9TELE